MYGSAIKVTQLHYVRAAADLGSFSRAATVLGVTQPALSNGIAALEQVLGGPLFERSTTGVALTPLGVRLLPHLQAVLTDLDAMLGEARAATRQEAEPLRMGVSPLIHPDLVARVFQAARQQAPAALVLSEDDLADLETALLRRELDLILVPAVAEAAACQRRPIHVEPVHYLAGEGDAATAGHPIELADLAGQGLVMVGDACGLATFTRRLFSSARTPLHTYPGEAESYRTVEHWAHLGLGGAILPLSRFRAGERTRPLHLDGEPVSIAYEALWLPHTPRARAIETLLDTVLEPDPESLPGDGEAQEARSAAR
jgi:DNA-binding transcriptional LysR family regulator